MQLLNYSTAVDFGLYMDIQYAWSNDNFIMVFVKKISLMINVLAFSPTKLEINFS